MRSRNRRIRETEEMNITAFMNLMVILVPFLLITAVFSKMSILELNIPKANAAADQNKKPQLQLQVIIRDKLVDIQDGNVGLIKRFQLDDNHETSWNSLSDLLVQLKTKFPDKESVTLLMEQDIPYRLMVKVMDRVRTAEIIQPGMTTETVELFPAISIGDAPVLTTSGGRK